MTEHTNDMRQGRLGAAREAAQDAHEDTSEDRIVLFSGATPEYLAAMEQAREVAARGDFAEARRLMGIDDAELDAVLDAAEAADPNREREDHHTDGEDDRDGPSWQRPPDAELATWAPHDLSAWLDSLAEDPAITDTQYLDAQAAVNTAYLSTDDLDGDQDYQHDADGEDGHEFGSVIDALDPQLEVDAIEAGTHPDLQDDYQPSLRELTGAFIAALDSRYYARYDRAHTGTDAEEARAEQLNHWHADDAASATSRDEDTAVDL